jgi:osmotically-inducible protein OsmY
MRRPSEIRDLNHSETAAKSGLSQADWQRSLQRSLLRMGVECRFEGDAVTLSGTVSSYYEKQLAQEIVMRLKRPLRVKNQCEVMTPNADPR